MKDIKQFFYAHPVFRYETFASFMTERGITSANSWRKSLQYHTRVGNIVLIKRGLYGVLNPMTDCPSAFYIDPLLIAGQAADDAVLAYHTALEVHRVAYSTFKTVSFMTQKHIKPFNFQTQRYEAIRPAKALIQKGEENFATEKSMYSAISIRVTRLERAVVDVIDRPNLSGGWEEIWRSLEHIVALDFDTLFEYLLRLEKANVVAKVGFVLDTLTTMQGFDKTKLDQLLAYLPKKPSYLQPGQSGHLVKKWRLIVPAAILNQSWEEQYDADV